MAPGQTLVVSVGNLVVAPSAVTFPNVEADLVYVMTLTIRNRGPTVSRLRIRQPQTSHFTLNYVPVGSIAPGMALNADIEFHLSGEELAEAGPPSLGQFHDSIIVTNGDDQVEVLLKALMPAPYIEFNPVLDLGLVICNSSITQNIPLVNMGSRIARWKLVFDEGSPLSALPQEGVLAPYSLDQMPTRPRRGDADDDSLATSISVESSRQSSAGSVSLVKGVPNQCDVAITLKAGAVGSFRTLARLEVEGSVPQMLDISAQVVEQSLSVVFLNSKRPLRVVDFGNTLYGEVAVIESLIVNDGPNPLPYFVALEIDRSTTESMAKQMAEDLGAPPPPSGGGSRSGGRGAGGSVNSISTHDEGGSSLDAVTATPTEGILAPYSTQPLTFRFQPTPPKINTGFERVARSNITVPVPHALKCIIESAKQAAEVTVIGRASSACVVVTMGASDKVKKNGNDYIEEEEEEEDNRPPISAIRADNVRFGECPVNERRDVLVTVRNTSAAPITYNFTKLAHFEVQPPSGSLQPLQLVSTVLTFRPSQLGKFKKKLKLIVQSGAMPLEVPIWVSGLSSSIADKQPRPGGIDKVPLDFAPKLQFIDPYIASGVIAAPKKDNDFIMTKDGTKKQIKNNTFIREKPYEVVNLLQSSSWDESVDGLDNNATSHLTYSIQDLAKRAEHKDQYSEWLKNTRIERELKESKKFQSKKTLLSNPHLKKLYSKFDSHGVPTHDLEGNLLSGDDIAKLREGSNLGMERGLDSIEPEPEMPKGDEPLWLLRSKNGQGGDSSQKRVSLDDKKLIAKKYKSTPTTQAEIRECAAELGSDEHNKVVVSHKSIDFGRVCVGSTSARSLSFSNDLQRSVLVRLGTLDTSLGQSGPQSQVIPAGCTAGFDIILSSTSEEIFRRTITYSINDRHSHKLSVSAEVVPIEVIMSAKSLDFKFPEDEENSLQLDASVNRTLTITNPGNCPAEYFWANRGPFTVTPEMGKLPAGGSAELTVTWTPTSGQANLQSLALHVPGGEDQQLTVNGSVAETKCTFSKKKLDLGLLPVGIAKEVTVGVKNVGKHSAVCFVQDLDFATTGISVKPSAVRIPVGATEQLVVTVQPPIAQSYAGVAVEINVRGAKPLRLPINAEAIVPDVSFFCPASRPPSPLASQPENNSQGSNSGGGGGGGSSDGGTNVISVTPGNIDAIIEGNDNNSRGSQGSRPIVPSSNQSITENSQGKKGDPLAGRLFMGLPVDGNNLGVLDFKDVTIGGSERQTITLINKSPISASLFLNFTKMPDFKASRNYDLPYEIEEYLISYHNSVTGGAGAGGVVSSGDNDLLTGQDDYNSDSRLQTNVPPTPTGDMAGTQNNVGGGSGGGGVNIGAEREKTDLSPLSNNETLETTKNYVIIIGAYHAISLNIDFIPTAPESHDFMLPLRLSGQDENSINRSNSSKSNMRRLNNNLNNNHDNNSLADASLNSKSNDGFPMLSRRVQAKGLRPRLIMSKAIVDFGDRVVSRDPNRRVPFSSEVSFSNSSSMGVTWMLDDRTLREAAAMATSKDGMPSTSVFFISPKNGDIAPGESVTLRVTFSPQDNQDYEAKLPLFLEDQVDKERPYLTLTLRGSGVFPRLDFSTREVVLQTVPLGVTSKGSFSIENCGYDDLSLTARPTMNSPVPINVEFPQGDNLGLTMASIGVIVSFSSETPVSFQTALEFVDSEGKTYSITVIGATDNSALTTFTFLQQYSNSFGYYTRDGKPVQFIGKQRIAAFERHELREKEKARGARAAARSAEKGKVAPPKQKSSGERDEPTLVDELSKCGEEQVDLNLEPNIIDPRLPEFLKEWLNANVMFEPMTNEFPIDFITSNGKLAFDAIDTMSSTKCPGRIKNISTDPNVGWKELQQQYSTLLLYLKEKGALLNHVQPIELFGIDDYLRAKEAQLETSNQQNKQRLSTSQLRERRAGWASGYASVSSSAWLTVMLQCIRTFMLSRITPKSFASLPGVLISAKTNNPNDKKNIKKGKKGSGGGNGGGGGGGDPELDKSNVYTIAEALLLKWVAYHVNATTPAAALPKRITDFDTSWADGALLCHVLHSHRHALVEGEAGEKIDPRASSSHHRDASGSGGGGSNKQALPPLHGYTQVTSFSDLKVAKTRQANYTKATLAMEKLMVGIQISEDLLLEPQPAIILLFALHLYNFLPQIVPKATIEFGATLGKTTSKIIELKNPSAKSIRYKAYLEGCNDFSLPLNEVSLAPKSKYDFIVDLNPRFSSTVESRLSLLSARGAAGVQANHMVFTLKSRVDSRLPVVTKEIDTLCYDVENIEFDIVNPFDIATTFRIKLSQECVETLGNLSRPGDNGPPGAIANNGAGGSNGGNAKGKVKKQQSGKEAADSRTEEEKAVYELFQQPFAAKQKSLFLEPGAKGKLGLSFIPFVPGTYKCEIVLLSPEAGEFCYACTATVKLPKVFDSPLPMRVIGNSGTPVQRIMRIPPKNMALENALKTLLDRLPSAMRTKGRMAGQALSKPPPPPQDKSSNNNNAAAAAAASAGVSVPGQSNNAPAGSIYNVEVDSNFFQTRPKVEIGAERKTSTAGGGKVATLEDIGPETDLNDPTTVFLTFIPRAPGTYPCEVLISAMGAAALDVRRYMINCIVVAPSVDTSLSFSAPARMGITQLIPLNNKGKDEWNLQCVISGPSSKCFTGPTTFKVPPLGEKAGYPLSFKANWMNETHEAVLLMKNPKSATEFKYELTGECLEPLAEEHIVRRCNARESVSVTLKVPNYVGKKGETLNLVVESDLPFIAGPDKLVVPADGEADYVLTAAPPMGGNFTGAITFKASSGEYLWYTLEFNVDSPLQEKSIDMTAVVRTVASMSITLENPISEPITFEVNYMGDGVLGDKTFSLQANESASYELFYSPLLVKKHSGSLAFLNDLVGEFWYKLNLTAEPASPLQLQTMRAPVGSKVAIPVTIENPLGRDVQMISKVSNSINFKIEPDVLNIGPYGKGTCYLEYWPSSLGQAAEVTDLSLSHEDLGSFDFYAEGYGEMPGVMPPVKAMACCGEPSSFMLTFRNPFRSPLMVDIILSNDESQQQQANMSSSNSVVSGSSATTLAGGTSKDGVNKEFILLMRKKENISMAPLSTLQVPISFNPFSIAEKFGQVEIRGSTSAYGLPLTWVFPLIGISSAPQHPRALNVKTKAKLPNRVILDLPLKALDDLLEPETFGYELVVPPNMQKLVASSLKINPLQSTISDASMPIRLQLVFTPMKPFATSIQLVVLRQSGGRWPFEVQLEATEPDFDDNILVESPLRTTGSVSFKLSNRTESDEFSNFQAFFSSDSSTCFTVSPNSGVLAPFSAGGTNFIVNFTPVEYGQRYRGKLTIATDDTQWTYDVTGDKPKDKTPQVKSIVDTRSHLSVGSGGSQQKNSNRKGGKLG